MRVSQTAVCGVLAGMLLIAGAYVTAPACPYIQGVIDWGAFPAAAAGGNLKDMATGKWLDKKEGEVVNLPDYMLGDQDVMLPTGAPFGSSDLRVLTGGMGYKNRSDGDTSQEVDFFEIWANATGDVCGRSTSRWRSWRISFARWCGYPAVPS